MESKQTVLVVDDDPQVARLIGRMLEGAGYGVVMAEGAVQALRAVAECRPDLMILDLNLSGVHGSELLELLRTPETRYTPAIAITGDHLVDEDELRASGFVALVHKPFTPSQLRRTVGDCIG